jgi:hypothetical protein
MSKRAPNFERIAPEKYQTPFKPVPPLIPYLRRDGIKTFAEICEGDGKLVRHLESFGLRCVYHGDIATEQDALKLTIADLNGADAGITNPPYKYPEDPTRGINSTRLLRDLIRHSLGLGIPFYFLLQHDWSTNENVAPFLDYCSDIIVAGRVQWIPNSRYRNGFDNVCWYRFDARHRGGPRFRNDRGKSVRLELLSLTKEAAE